MKMLQNDAKKKSYPVFARKIGRDYNFLAEVADELSVSQIP